MGERIKYDCPKCGSSRIKAAAGQSAEDYVTTTVSCLQCGFVGGEVEDNYADYPTAIAAWNRAARKASRP